MENQNIKKSNTRKIFTFLMYFIFGLYPIYGANKWGWTFNEVIALYWFEGIIIICDAFIRFLFIHEDYLYYDAETKKFRPMTFRGSLRYKFGKLILYLFILSFFSVLHGAVVYSVFVNTSSRMITDPFDGVNRLIELIFSHETLVNAIYASITMHAFLLLVNYFLSGVYKSNEALESIAKPFVRLFFLHIAIFILAFVLNFISSDALILLFIFVAFKSFIEAMLSLYNLNKGTELKKQE